MKLQAKFLFVMAVVFPKLAFSAVLSNYVAQPEPKYGYQIINKVSKPGYTKFLLELTSLEWKAGVVTPSLWKHWLEIIEPDSIQHTKAFLLINGGSHNVLGPGHLTYIDHPEKIALKTNSVVTILHDVPAQPALFQDEANKRIEDQITAYTFDRFLKTGDTSWPVLLPMAKSVVKAMDAIQSFAQTRSYEVDKFFLTGGSKRGWTTWLTAAVDDRVFGIAPMVIDLVNLKREFAAQIVAYKNYTRSWTDFLAFDIPNRILTERRGQELLDIVDPYEYRKSLTLPKMIMSATGDYFWTVDSASHYFPDLLGEKHLYYAPNSSHFFENNRKESQDTVLGFYHMLLNQIDRPSLQWNLDDEGNFDVQTSKAAAEMKVWEATSQSRDFRAVFKEWENAKPVLTVSSPWTATEQKETRPNHFKGKIKKTAGKFTAYFLEATFDTSLGVPYKVTTEVSVISK